MTPSPAKKVLVIDDDHAIRDLIELTLSEEGFCVLLAEDGTQALNMISSNQPDLILVDSRMPGMDGKEFATQYRTIDSAVAPLIVLTAVSDPAASADDIGAEAFLAKPFDLEELIALVQRYTLNGYGSPS